jgi:hypothetical protein
MPSTVPRITFNEDGLCNYCQSYQTQSFLGEKELYKIIDNAKDKKRIYDCIVGISGGRDSTYVLYLAKKHYGMKVLAVNYDNEFAPPYAVANMKRACDILNINFVSVRSKRDYVKKIAKHSILAATEFGQFRECAGCTFGYRSVVYRKAREYGIPLILWGESKEEATAEMELKAFDAIRQHNLKYIKIFKKDFYTAEFYRLLQRVEFFISWNNIFSRRFDPIIMDDNIKQIRVFDYVPWDRRKIKETIMNELKWEKPTELASTWKADCVMVALTNYYYIKLLGCTKLCFGYTRMINSGQMERIEALQQEEYVLTNYKKGLKGVLEDNIGLSEKDSKKILSH